MSLAALRKALTAQKTRLDEAQSINERPSKTQTSAPSHPPKQSSSSQTSTAKPRTSPSASAKFAKAVTAPRPASKKRARDAEDNTSTSKESNTNNKRSKSSQSGTSPSATTSLASRLTSKLASSRFRWLNEQLYTMTSDNAFQYFQSNPAEFDAYHSGFREQVAKWPINPVDEIIDYIQSHYPNRRVIADMGCGEAELSARLNDSHTVHSFDLVAVNHRVTVANIAHTPLPSAHCDLVVFCLSLMGTDYDDFLYEANRIMKPTQSELIIAEVTSRLTKNTNQTFIDSVKGKGFKFLQQSSNQYFVTFYFRKVANASKTKHVSGGGGGGAGSEPVLTPCIYKKR